MNRPGSLSITLAAIVTMLTTSCSSAPTILEGPYADDIRAAQGRATSEFQKEAFADGVITREEYIESLDRWVACMADAGLAAGVVPAGDGTFSYTISHAGGNIDAENDACHAQSIGDIELIYTGMLRNPAKLTGPELLRDCLVAAGALDPSVTVDQVNEQLGAIIHAESTIVDNSDPAVADCALDPFQTSRTTP